MPDSNNSKNKNAGRKTVYDADVLIAGAGAPGLALALLLAGEGLDVTLLDPAPLTKIKDLRPDTRTVALMESSVNIIKATGAWGRCEGYGENLEILRINDRNGRGRKKDPLQVDFKAQEIDKPRFAVNMQNNVLRAGLSEQAAAQKIKYRQDTLTGLNADDFGITATCGDGSVLRARLVIGTDGRNSAVRELSGIKCRQKPYGQQAITCLIEHSRPHGNISTEFHRPSGPFTLVPLPGNISSVVWVDFDAEVDSFMAMDKASFTQALQDRTEGALGTVTLAAEPQAYPLISLQSENLAGKRVALAAEAAHVIHPLGAQGLNLSLRDVAALAETIIDAVRLGQDYGSKTILSHYEKRRRQDMLSRIIGTDGLNKLVSNNIGLLHQLRRMGLKTIGGLPPVKNLTMREGFSPSFDDTRLARGEKL